MKEDLLKEIELPENVSVKIDHAVKITGPQGETEKKLFHPKIKIAQEGNKVVLTSKKATKKEKKVLNSFHSHLKNMIGGTVEKHVYKLRICSGHFPMNVSVSGDQLTIKNFLGETSPRRLTIKQGTDVKIEGGEIIVASASKELAGQVAADIEQLTKIKNRDIRIFQDGCYIVHKSGKDIE